MNDNKKKTVVFLRPNPSPPKTCRRCGQPLDRKASGTGICPNSQCGAKYLAKAIPQ